MEPGSESETEESEDAKREKKKEVGQNKGSKRVLGHSTRKKEACRSEKGQKVQESDSQE